ncbi:MAG: TonB-dependent receptor plug domain-containing protein, partial [Prevotella sp.]|nr:TonB-dependent receptor plug domain-containing protein [Prevotella sp.]
MSGNLKTFRIALTMLLIFLGGGILHAQTISGTVKDSSGEGVIGATIMEKGTTNGAVTDFDGNFTLKLTSAKNPIVVSYVGMKTQTVNVEGRSTVNIVLEDESTTLNELVIIGYGAVKKKDLTGSVATVGSDALVAVPVASATEALTGKMAGVQITTTEGSPDAEMSIRVRGGGSITQSNEPLFIVDGFPVESINDIPATDIEDITVLKDASSTAIYGSRGANGVILVTTKSGKEGKVKVSYNAYYSWKKIAKTLDVLDASDYVKWQYELAMLKNSAAVSNYEKFFGTYQDIDLYEG